MKILIAIEVNQPISIVFDQIADTRNEAKWNTHISDAKLITQGPIKKGSVFTEKNSGNQFTITLTAYNPPQSLSFQVRGKPMSIDSQVYLEKVATNRTKVTAEYTISPKGFMKIVMFLMAPMLRGQFAKEFENFKKFSESSANQK